MSLTAFVALPEVKSRLKQEYETPRIQCVQDMQIRPRTQSYGLTGTAFDYLMRFWIETLNPDAETKHWVAESSVTLLEEGKLPASAALKKTARKLLREAMICHSDYIKTRKLNDEIISTAVQLAQLDAIYRAGYIDPNLGKVSPDTQIRPPWDGSKPATRQAIRR